ncbi:MAG: hypothetical protein KDB18_08355 [Salinibacterium sp.]|nr:hypothetical protein [Salinibacterium sp.]
MPDESKPKLRRLIQVLLTCWLVALILRLSAPWTPPRRIGPDRRTVVPDRDDRPRIFRFVCVSVTDGATIAAARVAFAGFGSTQCERAVDDEGRVDFESWRIVGHAYHLEASAPGYESVAWRVPGHRLTGPDEIVIRLWPDRPRQQVHLEGHRSQPGDALVWVLRAPPAEGLVAAPRRGRHDAMSDTTVVSARPGELLTWQYRRRGQTLARGGAQIADRPLRLVMPAATRQSE